MGLGYIRGGGGGGINSTDVTAYKADVLKGKRTITADSGDEVAEGTMPDNTGINTNGTVPGINSAHPNIPTRPGTGLQLQTATDGVKRINISPPKGYYQGNNGSYVNRPASEFGNATAAQVLSGRKFTSENGLNIPGTIPSKAAATYYATTSDQIIAANQYLSGDQVIKKLTQTNLASGNILRGKTVSIHNGNANVWSVAGSNSVLRYIAGQSKGTNNGRNFRIQEGSNQQYKYFFYVDINPGFTPVFSISASNGLMQRTSQTAFNNADSGLIGHCTFVNASDAPFSSTQCRIFFPSYDSSASENVWYWIFGY